MSAFPNPNISAADDFLATLGVSTPPTTFRQRADVLLALGIPLVPLPVKSKYPPRTPHGAKNGTTDSDTIARWTEKYPASSNCAACAFFDGFWFLDDDLGTLAAIYKAATGQDMPVTFTVKTSRGFHYYFQHDDASNAARYGNKENAVIDIPGYKGEARCNHMYVVSPGSVHPSGLVYEICNDVPIVAAPPQLLQWLQTAYALSESLKERTAKMQSDRKAAPGFNKLSEAVGWKPLVNRLSQHPDNRFHNPLLKPGKLMYCPMPGHYKSEDKDIAFSATPFGVLKDAAIVHCFGCGFSGDMVATVYALDGGKKKYKNMYDAARAICKEENLQFDDFFPPKSAGTTAGTTAETFVESGTGPISEDTLVSRTADQITPKKIVWLWLNRFAQKLNLIVGNPDIGKGLITYYIIACLTTGRDWFDATNSLPASEAVILNGEEDWDDTVVPRLMSAGADRSKVHELKISATRDGKVTEKELQLDRDMVKLENFLEAHPNIRLVVVDPISNYLGNTKMIDEQKVRDVLTPLKEIANRRQVAVIGVMHLNKKVELDAIHRIGGAMAFVGVARMVWLCAPKPAEDGTDSDEMLMVKVKGNIVQRNLKGLSYTTKVHYVPIEGDDVNIPYVEWVGAVDQTANEVTGKPQKTKPAHRPAEQLPACIGWLREYLKDGAKTLGEIESDGKALHGFSPATIRRARNDEYSGVITFESGKRKGRDGKNYATYSCKLNAETLAELVVEEQTKF